VVPWSTAPGLMAKIWTLQPQRSRSQGRSAPAWKASGGLRPWQLTDHSLPTPSWSRSLAGPSELYDLLVAVLGLDELTATLDRLKQAAKVAEEPLEQTKKDLGLLLDRLRQLDDERATACLSALDKRAWDVEAAERVATGASTVVSGGQLETLRRLADLRAPAPDEVSAIIGRLRQAADRVEHVAGTESGQARQLAGLLEAALAHHRQHGDGDCPVCGRVSALDANWHERTETAVERLGAEAKAAEEAHGSARGAVEASKALLLPVPVELEADADGATATSVWKAWLAVPKGDDPPALRALATHFERLAAELAGAVGKVRVDAGRRLAEQEDRWSPVAHDIAMWCAAARKAEPAAKQASPLKEAGKWLTSAIDDLRNRRLRPLAEQCALIWGQLHQESNVELGGIRLTGSANRRQVDFRVTVDGTEGAALSVMSQGEVNALALSVFLPRVTMPASPFGFLVIDDPVQAMDPAKVEGLARVLSTTAAKRQVIVFTHDDRLPQVIRRLGLDATILEVTRRPESVVEIRPALDPSTRAIEDARAIVSDPNVPDELARRVVAGQCRLAVEAAFAEAYRQARLGAGDSHQAVEDALLSTSTGLTARAALALFGDAGRGGEVLGRLNGWGRWAADAYQAWNKGAHAALRALPRGLDQGHRTPGGQGSVQPDMSGIGGPADLLVSARSLCHKTGTTMIGLWPRAVALLAREAIESAASSYWSSSAYPAVAGCPMRSQLICLAEVVGRSLAGSAAATWSSLSAACHVHPYELAPTAGELLGWIDDAERISLCLANALSHEHLSGGP
jgi:hypothetical protein